MKQLENEESSHKMPQIFHQDSEPRQFKMNMSTEERERLEKLTQHVSPKHMSQVVRNSLQLLEELIREHCNGSEFYIKRKGDPEPVQYNLLGTRKKV